MKYYITLDIGVHLSDASVWHLQMQQNISPDITRNKIGEGTARDIC
jgi:hypothetical protein